MKQIMPWTQLAKYFAGELSKEENQKMKSWIRADPKRKEQARVLYKIWKETKNQSYQLNVDESWNSLSRIMDKIEHEKTQFSYPPLGDSDKKAVGKSISINKSARKSENIKRLIAFTVTAAATILIAFTFAYYFEPVIPEFTDEVIDQQFIAKQGEWATYELNDGSKVMLHPGSRLEIPAKFNVENRELFLEGEAYFDVVHDSENPFILKTKNSYTRVLGTLFLVQAWPDPDERVEVIVSEGKVVLGASRSLGLSNTKEAIITRSQRGVLTKDKDPVVTEIDDLDWYLGWTEGRLVFDNRPLSEIIFRLEYWYGVEIQLENMSIGTKKITGEIDNSQTMNEVLTGIAMSLDLVLEKENHSTTFRFKKQKH